MESQNSNPSQLFDVSLDAAQLTAEDVTAEEVVQSPRIDGTSLREGPQLVVEQKTNITESIVVDKNHKESVLENVVVESEGPQLVAEVIDSVVGGENGKNSLSEGVQMVVEDKANDGVSDSVAMSENQTESLSENIAVESQIKVGDHYLDENRVQIDSQQNSSVPAAVTNDIVAYDIGDVNITSNGKSDTDTCDSVANGTKFESPTINGTTPAASFASPAHGETPSLSPLPGGSPRNQPSLSLPPSPPHTSPDQTEKENRLQDKLKNYESQIEQLKATLVQKDNTIGLYQRENSLLEKEKSAFRKEKELATKEKENIVIKFATKEKSLIDAKKQKETVEKQLADSRKEVKNISTKFHALNEEKSRITYMLDEKCNELKRYQKELEKQRAEYGNLEMKVKWNSVKLAQETEAKLAAEKKLEEERNAPKPHEEKANEKLKMEYEATAILLKHEIENKDKTIETLTKEHKQATEKIAQLQESLSKEILENTSLSRELECLRQEHGVVQNSYSEEMLNSAKLRGQLEELQVLRTQHTINEDKINTLNESLRELEEKLQDSSQDLEQLHAKEKGLLSINKEMSEMIVGLQNEICLLKSKVQGVEAENSILKKEKLEFDTKYNNIESQLNQEVQQKNEERLLLTKHLSEKTKLYESVKVKLENAQGDLEATKKKHSQVVKELQREIQKYKKLVDENTSASSPTLHGFCRNCQLKSTSQERVASRGSNNSRSDSESEAQSTTSTMNHDGQGPSKQHLVERILRLQQASARQTEKIDFLENHTLSLVAELQKKSKVVQYYMMRDQAGALTSSKSDQNKTELAKYGGVMSAIYSGIKGPNQSMTLELSLEINKKLQAVLEDTLLKNITLKENLDVLGLEVDKLTRKLAQTKS